MEGIFVSLLCFYNVSFWQLSLLTHYQIQLSDKSCKNSNSERVSPSQPEFSGNFSTAHSDAVYSCAMKGKSSSAIHLLFMWRQVESYTCSRLFQFFFVLFSFFAQLLKPYGWMELEWMAKMIRWFAVDHYFYAHCLHADHKVNERAIKWRIQAGIETRTSTWMPVFKSSRSTTTRSQGTKSEREAGGFLDYVSTYISWSFFFISLVWVPHFIYVLSLSEILLEPSTNKITKVKSTLVGETFKIESNWEKCTISLFLLG